MSIFKKKKEAQKKYSLEEVFKSSGVPEYTFVKRNNIEETLDRKLKAHNCALLFLGYSKSGKTVYRKKYFLNKGYKLVIYRCNKDSVIGDLYKQIVNELEMPIKKEKTINEGLKQDVKSSGSIGDKSFFQATNELDESFESSMSLRRGYLDLNIDVNYICNNIKNKDKIVILLEDYHLVNSNFNQRFSEDLKHFIDEEITFIIIGIPSTADRSFKNNPDLSGRSERIKFDYLSYEEVDEIITKGGKFLNVEFSAEVREKIRQCSMCNAYLVQAICYEILSELNITETQESTFKNISVNIVEDACRKLAQGRLNEEYAPIVDVIWGGGRTQQEGKAYNQYAELIRGLKYSEIDKIEKGLTYKDIGKISWDSFSTEYIQKFIDKGVYKSETTFKTSLNNQISVAMDKIGENFEKKKTRPIIIVSDKKLYLMDIIFKFYLDWSDLTFPNLDINSLKLGNVKSINNTVNEYNDLEIDYNYSSDKYRVRGLVTDIEKTGRKSDKNKDIYIFTLSHEKRINVYALGDISKVVAGKTIIEARPYKKNDNVYFNGYVDIIN